MSMEEIGIAGPNSDQKRRRQVGEADRNGAGSKGNHGTRRVNPYQLFVLASFFAEF
jgi:hypothetical protein